MDGADFGILKAISDMRIRYPNVDRINSLVNLDPEELGARLGALEMEGYVETKSASNMDEPCLPNGICAAGLTNMGRRALAGPRW